MALIGRLFVILFGFLAASLVAGMIVVGAVLFPEFSDLGSGPIDPGALNIVLGFGFIFISGFALLPAMLVVAITEAFYVRSALAYAVGGGVVGLACYLGLVPFDPATLRFDGIVRRHLEIITGAGIVAGGPQCRRLARAAAPGATTAAAAVAFTLAAGASTIAAVILRSGLVAASRRIATRVSHPSRLASARASG